MLPPDTITDLRQIHADRANNPTLLYAYVALLHARGWTFDEIARPLGVSRSIVGQWKRRHSPPNPALLPAAPHKPKPLTGTIKKIIPDLSPEDQKIIQTTAEVARKRTRWSRKDSPETKAAEELAELIQKHVKERGVPASRFAEVAGVSRRAIMQRLEK